MKGGDMRLQMMVRKMELETEVDYASEFPYKKHNVTKVALTKHEDGGGPFGSVTLLVDIPPGNPNPFMLGQVLELAIDQASRGGSGGSGAEIAAARAALVGTGV